MVIVAQLHVSSRTANSRLLFPETSVQCYSDLLLYAFETVVKWRDQGNCDISCFTHRVLLQCVRIHTDGRMATVYLKRRDLLRLFTLDPRDLRCIDPNLHYTRLSPSLYVRGNVILAQLSGVRLIITGSTALLLDPHSSAARKLLGQLIPKLQVRAILLTPPPYFSSFGSKTPVAPLGNREGSKRGKLQLLVAGIFPLFLPFMVLERIAGCRVWGPSHPTPGSAQPHSHRG